MLETTEEECFTPKQKVFGSIFSIIFSLAGYHVFKLANPPRVRFEGTQLTDVLHSYFIESAESTGNTERARTNSTQFIYKSYNIRQ